MVLHSCPYLDPVVPQVFSSIRVPPRTSIKSRPTRLTTKEAINQDINFGFLFFTARFRIVKKFTEDPTFNKEINRVPP